MTNHNQRTAARKKRQKARKLSEVATKCMAVMPKHCKLTTFASDEWESLSTGPDAKHWEAAKGIVLGLVKGGGEPMRQPIFPELSPEQFLQQLMEVTYDPDMVEIEEKFASKFGSYTPLPYVDWVDKVHALWMEVDFRPESEALELAKRMVVSELKHALAQDGLDYVPVLPVETAMERVTKGRNSGWPYFSSKWSVNPEMRAYYLDKANRLIEGEDTLLGTPHILFRRILPPLAERGSSILPIWR